MSSNSHPSLSLPEMDNACSSSSENSAAYSVHGDVYNATDSPPLPTEITDHSMGTDYANLPVADSSFTDSATPQGLQPSEAVIPEAEQPITGSSKSPRPEAAGALKVEKIEEDDDVQIIKEEEESDDCIITDIWTIDEAVDVDAESIISVEVNDLTSQSNTRLDTDSKFEELEQNDLTTDFIKKEVNDNDDFVIGNIWSIHEAIDVDAIEPFKKDQGSQPMLAIDKRFKETEQDRVDQNHQLDRIALARQRLQVQSFVNNATTRDAQTEPERTVDASEEACANGVAPHALHSNNIGASDKTNPYAEVHDFTWGQSIVFEDAELEGIGGPSTSNPQSDSERSDGLFCSDYDEETKASLKRKHYIATSNGSSSECGTLENPVNAPPQTKRRKYPRNMKVSSHDTKESMKVALEPLLTKSHKGNSKTKKSTSTRKNASGRNPRSSGVSKNKKTDSKGDKSARKGKHAPNFNLQNLFRSDIIGEAQLNASEPAIPTFSFKNKKKALDELAFNCPLGETPEVKADKTKVTKVLRKFGRKLKADSKGGWKLKGMKTSLFHYQVRYDALPREITADFSQKLLGLEFMRGRENSEVAPFGGFMCDEMGFGKTIQALANIIDGAPIREDPIKTTLIVVPRHLVRHWANQIDAHCERDALGTILRYHAGSRPETGDPVRDLGQYGIIITTYDEVRRSYPVFCPPKDLEGTALSDWWEEKYTSEVGPLHTLKFRRIILDEAHMIKNQKSSTSMAVRGLTAKYRWVLSGTPVQNGVEEFFSFFDFLKIPLKGPQGYGRFVEDYKKGHDSLLGGLRQFVAGIMIRRTHTEKLFGLPILKLPPIDGTPIMVKFNKTEKFIHQLLGRSFVNLINSFEDPEDVDSQYRCILTMYLRLRMFTSHIFVVQQQLKDLLTANAVKGMREAIHSDGEPDPTDSKMVNILENLATNFAAPTSGPSQINAQHGQRKRNSKLIDDFCRFLNSLKDNDNLIELVRRCLCPICEQPPAEAFITSCMHIYCEGCLPVSENGSDNKCTECEVEISNTEYCHSIDALGLNEQMSSKSLRQGRSQKSKKGKPKSKSNPKDEELLTPDWIQLAGHDMHGAKLAATRGCIRNWFSKSSDTKVLIFTQFLEMGRILALMCERENWGFAMLNGKMSIYSREMAMKNFENDPETRIMISSLRVGGTGLDLAMANKCILLDLWWNHAVEQQAFCRVFRIGQKKEVEIVKIVVEGSTDDWLTKMQNRKTAAIDQAMGDSDPEMASMVEAIAKPFGTVKQQDDGLFRINPHEGDEQQEHAPA